MAVSTLVISLASTTFSVILGICVRSIRNNAPKNNVSEKTSSEANEVKASKGTLIYSEGEYGIYYNEEWEYCRWRLYKNSVLIRYADTEEKVRKYLSKIIEKKKAKENK